MNVAQIEKEIKELDWYLTIGWHEEEMPKLKLLIPKLRQALQRFATQVLENLKVMEKKEYDRIKKLREDGISFMERKKAINQNLFLLIERKKKEMTVIKNNPQIRSPEEWGQVGDVEEIERDIDFFIRTYFEIIT